MTRDFKADTPEIPHVYEAEWQDWVREVERFEINEDSVLVGHSTGGGFWVRYLTEHPELKVAKVILVAPYLNVNRKRNTALFDFTINPDITQQAQDFVIFASDNDLSEVQDTVTFLKEKLPNARIRNFHNYGHFCYKDLKTDAFPELLEEALQH